MTSRTPDKTHEYCFKKTHNCTATHNSRTLPLASDWKGAEVEDFHVKSIVIYFVRKIEYSYLL